MTAIGSDSIDSEWKLLNYIVNNLNGIFLIVAWEYLKRSDPCSIVNSSVLIAACR